MRRIMNVLFGVLLLIGIITPTIAQKAKAPNFSEGIISYKIEVEGAPEVAQFVQNSIINLYLKDDNSKMDISIMGGFASVQLINNNNDNLFTLLMDVPSFAEKTAISIDENSSVFKELNSSKNQNTAPQKEVEITNYKNKKKRIAKYACYKSEVVMGNDVMIVYITDKLRPTALTQFEKSIGKLDGFPLAFEMWIEGVYVKITAIEVSKKSIGTTVFDIPDLYSIKTLEEFKDEMQQKIGTGMSGVRL